MTTNNVVRELKLHSPAGVEPAIFTWPSAEQETPKKDGSFVGGDEIVKTIRLVFEDYPELYQQNLGLSTCDIHSYATMKELCDKFNKIIDTHIKLNRGTEAFSARLEQRASGKLFRHILQQVYSRSVTDPDKLRDYAPFSPSVYGETSPDLIDSILKTINLTEDQVFIDLGSGVGNVVLQVAALANCKQVYGIEYEETPAAYARSMADEFRSWMRWYGKQYSDFLLEQGDFLTHSTIDEKIREADVIFVNNYVFGSRVNHELKVKFMNMKDGAKIVSSREFCPETFRLNDRTKNDLGAIMRITKPEEFLGKVSWSDKSVQYYLQIIDHSKLAHFYEKMHHIHAKGPRSSHLKSNDDEYSLSPSSNNSSSNSKSKRKHRIIRINRKNHLDDDDDDDSDFSDDEYRNSKRQKDYHLTLNELHPNDQTYYSSNSNQRFNYQHMTKLSNENLRLRHFRDCLEDQEDYVFFNAVNNYLDSFRQRLYNYRAYMKSNVYREHIKQQVDHEMELNKTLKSKVNSLENHMKILLEDTISLFKLRTNELGIAELERPAQLITYANDISNKHKELRSKVVTLEKEISDYEYENEKLSYILQSIQTNGHPSISNDNTYSALLANMSRQTQQQESSSSSSHSNRPKDHSTERKSGFTIPKKTKKNSSGNTSLPPPPSTVAIGINNLLSTKQLEPVQVHSVGQQQAVIQCVSVKTLLNHSPTSNTKSSQLSEEISRSIMQSPRKKRDFYGKSAGGPSTTPTPPSSSTSSPNSKSHRHTHTGDSSSATNSRPSSTPACTVANPAPNLPDRPVSIPPFKTSS